MKRAAMVPLVLGLILIAPSFAATAAEPVPHVNVIELDNQIVSPPTAQYILRAIERSEVERAVCLVIKLDTPGGLMESTREIVKRMMNARVPIVVYVAPSGARAGSAGVFITLAAHVAVMAPSTNIGAAHPVMMGDGDAFRRLTPGDEKQGGKPARSPMEEKILNDTVAWATAISNARGRNADWARRAVTESISVTEDEAVKEKVVDLIARDLPDLLAQLNGRTVNVAGRTVALFTARAAVKEIPMSLRQKVLATIVNPNVAYLLMMLGVLGLIVEFTHPGLGLPGVGGLICLLLALYAFQVLPVNYAAIALIVLGLALLAAEAVVTSHGLLALGGLVALVLGSLMLFDAPEAELRVSLSMVLAVALTLSAIMLFILQRALRSRAFPVATGQQGMIGEIGEAITDLAPDGLVFIHGETWEATSAAPVPQGKPVRVSGLDGLRLTVVPAADHTPDLKKGEQ